MEEFELFGHQFPSVEVLEGSLIAFHLNEIILEVALDVVVCSHPTQSVGVLGYSKHDAFGHVELHLDGEVLFSPLVCPQVEDFLRSPGALDGHGGFREDGFSRVQLSCDFGHFLCVIELINRPNIRIGVVEGFFEALDLEILELQASGKHQLVICKLLPIVSDQGVALWLDQLDPVPQNGGVFREGLLHLLSSGVDHPLSGPDHGPSGLVVVEGGRVNDKDFLGVDPSSEQVSDDAESACASSSDNISAVFGEGKASKPSESHILLS
jgi:hypothetical protein